MKSHLIDKFPGMAALEIIYEDHARDCTKCGLHEGRNKVVFGTGNTEEPDIAFVGEAPGKDEDEQGFPFVGKAGQLLTEIIHAMGYKRDEVYILNSVCCRPPGNRNPSNDELSACWPIMASQLKAVRPKVIVCLGGAPVRQVLQTNVGVGDLRRKWHAWDERPVRVTYHPAYLLRRPDMKSRTWADMKAVLKLLGRETSSE